MNINESLEKDKGVVDHIKSIQDELIPLNQVKSHTGFCLSSEGKLLRYHVDKESWEVLQIIEGVPSDFDSLMNFLNVREQFTLVQKLVQLSNSEFQEQRGNKLMQPIDLAELVDFIESNQDLSEFLPRSDTINDLNKSEKLHELILGKFFFLQDLAAVIDSIRHSDVFKSNFTSEQLKTISNHVHNISSVISIFSMGVYFFYNQGDSIKAHQKFVLGVHGLLDYLRSMILTLSSNFQVPFLDNTSLDNVIKSSIQIFIEELEVKINLDRNIAGDNLPAEFAEDIYKIVFNLVVNAWKYSMHASARSYLGTVPEPIKVDIHLGKDNNVTISVSDSGIPISEEDKKRVLMGEQVHLNKPALISIPTSGQGIKHIQYILSKYPGGLLVINDAVNEAYTKAFIATLPYVTTSELIEH